MHVYVGMETMLQGPCANIAAYARFMRMYTYIVDAHKDMKAKSELVDTAYLAYQNI